LCPPSCSPQIGVCFSPDQAWRQGLAEVDSNDNPILGTNADLLDVIEGKVGLADRDRAAAESGDEASCSGGMVDTSDCESDLKHDPHVAQQGAPPMEATADDDWLQAVSREELMCYVQHLEKEVCRLKLVRAYRSATCLHHRVPAFLAYPFWLSCMSMQHTLFACWVFQHQNPVHMKDFLQAASKWLHLLLHFIAVTALAAVAFNK
jgi:hypothetical protein